MSRLDSFIRRLEAQRRVLDWGAQAISGCDGVVLELGLGNGRTYDHLRQILPGRRIYAFDREAKANPRSMPPRNTLVIGEMAETLPRFAKRHGRSAVLIHLDAARGVPDLDNIDLVWLPTHIAALARDKSLILSSSELNHPALIAIALPPGVPAERYFAYRRGP